ncbi:MAG: hypothetical protein VYE81_03695, partial [Planctomycetota bacterium]|nr:hypothetical protein [Planctomycetota bacterium]
MSSEQNDSDLDYDLPPGLVIPPRAPASYSLLSSSSGGGWEEDEDGDGEGDGRLIGEDSIHPRPASPGPHGSSSSYSPTTSSSSSSPTSVTPRPHFDDGSAACAALCPVGQASARWAVGHAELEIRDEGEGPREMEERLATERRPLDAAEALDLFPGAPIGCERSDAPRGRLSRARLEVLLRDGPPAVEVAFSRTGDRLRVALSADPEDAACMAAPARDAYEGIFPCLDRVYVGARPPADEAPPPSMAHPSQQRAYASLGAGHEWRAMARGAGGGPRPTRPLWVRRADGRLGPEPRVPAVLLGPEGAGKTHVALARLVSAVSVEGRRALAVVPGACLADTVRDLGTLTPFPIQVVAQRSDPWDGSQPLTVCAYAALASRPAVEVHTL